MKLPTKITAKSVTKMAIEYAIEAENFSLRVEQVSKQMIKELPKAEDGKRYVNLGGTQFEVDFGYCLMWHSTRQPSYFFLGKTLTYDRDKLIDKVLLFCTQIWPTILAEKLIDDHIVVQDGIIEKDENTPQTVFFDMDSATYKYKRSNNGLVGSIVEIGTTFSEARCWLKGYMAGLDDKVPF